MASAETAGVVYTPHPIIPRLDLDNSDLRPETVKHHLNRYAMAARSVEPGSYAVDICCGTGYGTSMLKEAGAAKAVGVDLSLEAVANARKRYRECAFVQESAVIYAASMLTGDQVQQPDVITLFEAIEHMDRADDISIFDSVQGALAEDGHFFVSTPTDIRADVNPDHRVQWEFEELAYELGSRFGSVDIFGQDWTTGEFRYETPETASFMIADCTSPIRG